MFLQHQTKLYYRESVIYAEQSFIDDSNKLVYWGFSFGILLHYCLQGTKESSEQAIVYTELRINRKLLFKKSSWKEAFLSG